MVTMKQLPRAAQALTDLGIEHRVFKHLEKITSLAQAAAERGQTPRQVIRSLLFRLGAGNFVMVLMPGQKQVSWPGLRTYCGQSRLSLAKEAEVLSVTGYRIGTVSPFGLPGPLRLLADESIFEEPEISLGSGEANCALILSSADLKKALPHLEIGQFAELK
jgi:Cys-tRNA(Pro)/Cys-tRNA(Cys) deacylase